MGAGVNYEKRNSNIDTDHFDEWFRFSELVASTGLCPKDMRGKPADVLVAMQLGVGIGMAPLQAIQSIAVINGRPCLWGDAMLALVKAVRRACQHH